MVREDLFAGRVLGDTARSFLGGELAGLVPAAADDPIAALRKRRGDEEAERRLVARFFELGERGHAAAEAAWRALGRPIGGRRHRTCRAGGPGRGRPGGGGNKP